MIYGYKYETCPICKSKTFDHVSYSEFGWGIVEEHGLCKRCGYIIEKAYSPTMEGFMDIKKGFKNHNDDYIPKDVKRHKRIRRKRNISGYPVNEYWMFMI